MLLDQNSLIFDIGANVGEVTRIFSKTNARVIAFEPHPNAFIKLQKKFKKVDQNFSAIETRYGSGYRWNVS